MSVSCIRLSCLEKFQCDGNACQSRCCGDWRVTVDEDTLRKYARMEPEQERKRILSHIIYRKPLKSFGITMKRNGRCPFLGEDYLCSIQKCYGEAYISDICATYPRVFYQIGDLMEESLAITCPVAAELILFSDEPLRFETVSVSVPRKTQIALWTEKVTVFRKIWRIIQEKCIGLLQDRRFSMDERLLRMLYLLNHLDHAESKETFSETELPGQEDSPAQGGRRPDFSTERHVRFMAGLFARLYPLELTEEKISVLTATYEKGRQIDLPALLTVYGEPLENYLVNEFFLRLYPFAYSGSLLYNGKLFCIAAKLVEFSLLLTAANRKGDLRKEDFLRIVERISQRLDHSRDGMDFLKDAVSSESAGELVSDFAAYMLDIH